jgi:hypothetical protein
VTDYLTCEACGARKCGMCYKLIKAEDSQIAVGPSVFHAGSCFDEATLLHAAYIDYDRRAKARRQRSGSDMHS